MCSAPIWRVKTPAQGCVGAGFCVVVLPAARIMETARGGRRMSPGGLFAETGPDGGDGPSHATDVT